MPFTRPIDRRVSPGAPTAAAHHKKDVNVLPDENALLEQLKKLNLTPGTYMWPNCQTNVEMNSEEFKARFNTGPWGSINIVGEKPNFGRNLLLTALFYVVVSVVVAYVTGQANDPGALFQPVFRVAGAAGVLGYCAGSIPNAIFFSKPARFVLTDFVDSLVYGLLTAVTFALMWPAAS